MNSPSVLPEFLATVSAARDPIAATRAGLIGIAETFDAEIAAIVRGGEVAASTGFPRGAVPRVRLVAAASGERETLLIPGGHDAVASAVSFGPDQVLVVARVGEALDRSELAHAQAMARVLDLALRLLDEIGENQRLIKEQQSRQAVLEAILRIQRLISQRHPIDTILEAITGEAATLLAADLAGIVLHGPEGVARRALAGGVARTRASVMAIPDDELAEIGRRAAGNELSEPVAVTIPGGDGETISGTIVGAPVSDDGRVIGGFYVLTGVSHPGAGVDTAAIQTLASQASIALTDASTVDELHHAFHDTLTGLPNRALFQDRFEHALALGTRKHTTTALLFIDLDRFKIVNDTFGHAAGDALLSEVARRLAGAGRAYDSVARIGGDEFAVLIEDTSAEAAELVAKRLLDELREIDSPSQSSCGCSASIGVAVTGPECDTTDELLRRADIAMYSVKSDGRSGVAVYRPSMGGTRLDESAMSDALRAALAEDLFVVHYQPIVNLQSRRISGVEALVRWNDPERGLMAPADFISAAEESGMIVPIGRRVLHLACEQAARWRRDLPAAAELTLSVNLSGRQLQHDGIVEEVAGALDSAGLEPEAVTLEVTESIFVGEGDPASECLRSLKDLGVRLAIDDFGTGFSSLSYIHNYPFDELKIDRSFVKGLGTMANSGAVVKTMLALAQQLSMSTVAEGIENPAELAQLRALRCSHGQGFLFSRPIDASNLEQLLTNPTSATARPQHVTA